MQRNVIQLSTTSAGMSLPSKWLKKWELKKGDALNVEENEGILEIKPVEFKPSEKMIEIDTRKYQELSGRKISSLASQGYDEIKVNYDTEKNLKIIKKYLQKEVTMMEIVKKEKNYIIIRVISEINEQELQNIIRKLVSLIEEDIHKAKEYIKTYDQSLLDDILDYELIMNKLVITCTRALNKHSSEDKSYSKYTLIWILEKLGDDFKFFAQNKFKNIKEETKELFDRLFDNLMIISELYLNYDGEKAKEFYKKRKELANICLKQLEKNKDSLLLHHCMSMNEKGMYILGLIIGSN
jgi:phosphate uptake regulator